jgi:nucleotide-binding universal stress UspA family protein
MTTTKFRRILFAVDLGSSSRAAVPAVARLALLTGATVKVAHVWDIEKGPVGGRWEPEGPAEARAVIRQLTAGLQALGVPTITELRIARADGIAHEIVSSAREWRADLIALGSRGLSDIQGLVLGSVSHRVMAGSDCPVLVVRMGGRRRGGPIRRILLAVAGGEEVPNAVATTKELARLADAEVMVLHARYLVAGGESVAFLEPADDSDGAVAKIVGELRRARIRAAAQAPVATAGVPREIAQAARAFNADLLVLGSRRLSDFGSLFLGGIDHAVIHLSDRPVLVAERPRQSRESKTS